MNYRAIGFDYGGVIYGQPGPLFNRELARRVGADEGVMMREYFSRNHQANVGILSFDEVWQQVFEALGKTDRYADFLEFQKEWGAAKKMNTSILELADRLRANGYKTGILSNTGANWAASVREQGIDTHFDVYLPSCELGFMKPDPRAYAALTEALGVEPESLIFIDDTPRSLESADEVGYTPVLFENYADLVKSLKNLGLVF